MAASDHPILTGPTARAVLAQLLRTHDLRRIWFPAYCCPEMAQAPAGYEMCFYPVGAGVQPDPSWLEAHVNSGDVVLAINYFGQSPGADFRALVAARDDILWIEDCAQALEPETPWGDWQIFSPRKLFGVPDGGIARCRNAAKAIKPSPPVPADHRFSEMSQIAPLLWRFEDAGESENATWYKAFKDAERQSAVTDREAISAFSQRLLQAIDATEVAAKRRANAAALHDLLPQSLRFWQMPPAAPPLGYPVLLDNRDSVAAKLAEQGLFCATHWRDIPAPADAFPAEQDLSQRLLTLPCDQRYDRDDMVRIAQMLLAEIS